MVGKEVKDNICPKCKSPLLRLRSLNKKLCSGKNCGAEYDWFLEDKQKPLIQHQR